MKSQKIRKMRCGGKKTTKKNDDNTNSPLLDGVGTVVFHEFVMQRYERLAD